MNFSQQNWIINIGGIMKKILGFSLVLVLLSCTSTYVEQIVTSEGAILNLDGAVFELPENSVRESTLIRIHKTSTGKHYFEQGYTLTGQSYTILPETLTFDKPIRFSMPITKENLVLGAKIGNGFVPLANSVVKGESLHAKLWHGGEYCIVEKPTVYGIQNYSDLDEGMIIVSDLYISDYITDFKKALKQIGYKFPVWTFIYTYDNSIEENAVFLAGELKKLHEEYGEFKLDIVSFGVGGLITHRYITDSLLYQKDISPAVIAIGTPFFGSEYADLDKAKYGKSPYRFFFIDALDKNAEDIIPESDFISWLEEHKRLRGGWCKDVKEDKNPASISAKKHFPGELQEDKNGDGLVSVSSTMLTALEPEPFRLGHFELFESPDVHLVVGDFVQLYRSFAWMDFFLKVWQEKEPLNKINKIWEREAKLHYRNPVNFDILVEYNANMLKSAPNNAILITNGDNDTYPGWFLQGMGVRKDIIILNRSLANLKEYLRYLIKQGLPLDISDDEIEALHHDYNKKSGKLKTISDKIIEKLLKQNKRPVVFAATVYSPEQYGYPLKLSGLIYEISEYDGVDIERTKNLLYSEFSYDNFFSLAPESLSKPIQNLANNYAGIAHELSTALADKEMYNDALKANDHAKQFVESRSYYFLAYNDAKIYQKIGRKDKADSAFQAVLSNAGVDVSLRKEIANSYFDMNMKEKAIEILADCLKDDPGNKEIIELIEKYQEGL